MEIQADWGQIQRLINDAGWGRSGKVVKKFADRFGCSTDKIYRELRKHNGLKREVKRPKKVDPQNELIKKIMELKELGKSIHFEGREVKTEWCIEELRRQCVEGAGDLTVSTVNRRLVDIGYRERQPSKRIESEYANQVHMIDFSRSKYFQLFDYDARKDDYMLVVSGKELHYKKDDARLRTWIVQYMDDYSRLRKVKAYAETQESAFLGLDHLNFSWSAAGENPLHYPPLEMLRSDNGSFRKSKETIAAMEALDVHLTKQMPGRKGGTAKVENRFRSLWQEFELTLAIRTGEGERLWLSDYNDMLAEFCAQEQAKEHPYEKGVTRGERYKRSLADRSIKQRTIDVDVIRLACRVERRKVDDHLRISLDNSYYEVPQYVDGIPTIGKKVYVHKNKYGELTGKLIDNLATASFELAEWTPARWGTEQFESFKRSPKRMLEDAFEEEKPTYQEVVGRKQDAVTSPAAKAAPPSKGDSTVRYMKPETEQVEPDSPFNEKMAAAGRLFQNELDAREYIGIRVEAWGLSFSDVENYFDFEELPAARRDLDTIIEQIGSDFDNGTLSMAQGA